MKHNTFVAMDAEREKLGQDGILELAPIPYGRERPKISTSYIGLQKYGEQLEGYGACGGWNGFGLLRGSIASIDIRHSSPRGSKRGYYLALANKIAKKSIGTVLSGGVYKIKCKTNVFEDLHHMSLKPILNRFTQVILKYIRGHCPERRYADDGKPILRDLAVGYDESEKQYVLFLEDSSEKTAIANQLERLMCLYRRGYDF